MIVGTDKNGQLLKMGDVCTFELENYDDMLHEGVIDYDEETFSFAFEMLDSTFPIVLMQCATIGSIEKITNIWDDTDINERYKKYREIVSKNNIV